jgi:hypothetical protein
VRVVRPVVATSLLTLACMAHTASANLTVPSPVYSSVPASVCVCPMGDLPYGVVIRDNFQNPMRSVVVTLDLGSCTGLQPCAGGIAPYNTLMAPAYVQATTDAFGPARFFFEAAGGCSGSIMVYASAALITDGSTHSPVVIANADQSGDGIVNATDAAMLDAKGPGDPTADLTQDGVHDAVDALLLSHHLGHECPPMVVPARRPTWGQLKMLYR